jgi:serine/threonine-protein kinase
MRRFLRFALLGLILILVMMLSAVTAMRFAIHGRELLLPKFIGMKQSDAQRVAEDNGLVLAVDERFYSASVPQGAVLSQAPGPGVRVRRGTRVRVAISLGAAKNEVPDLTGQSVRAAQINVQRRGLDIGEVSSIAQPNTTESQIISQSPTANSAASSPKISLLVSDPEQNQTFLMPDFTRKQLSDVERQIKDAGFELKVNQLKDLNSPATPTPAPAKISAPKHQVIVNQTPPAGHRIAAKSTIIFEVAQQ